MIRVYYFLAVLLILISGCAVENAPGGGPKDRRPPKVVSITPPDSQIHFSANTIEINFDEYVVVKNVKNEFLCSPPLEKNPEIFAKSKKVIVKFKDSLKANTTYTLSFGKSIVDFTEGNALKDFSYVFSTGSVLDSLQIAGHILDAFTHKPASHFMVLLYPYLNDSLPKTETPLFVCRSDKNGFFRFVHLPQGAYFLFALKDINGNYRFDLPEENIAFLDSFITPTVIFAQDTLTDSTILTRPHYRPNDLQLLAFKENHEKQYIASAKRPLPWKCSLVFHLPMEEKPTIDFLQSIHHLIEYSTHYDTVTVWLTDSNEVKNDTITASVKFMASDSLQTDTVAFTRKPRHHKKKPKLPSVTITLKNQLPIYEKDSLFLLSSEPLIQFTDSNIYLTQTDAFKKTDTLSVKLTPVGDSSHRRFFIAHPWKSDMSYALHFDSAAVVSFLGHTNDSTVIPFTVNDISQYGSLVLHLHRHFSAPLILLLTNAKGKTLRTIYLSETDTLASFSLLLPGEYGIKAIVDDNHNKKWDSGYLSGFKQAERILFFDKSLQIRAGWEGNESWEMNEK